MSAVCCDRQLLQLHLNWCSISASSARTCTSWQRRDRRHRPRCSAPRGGSVAGPSRRRGRGLRRGVRPRRQSADPRRGSGHQRSSQRWVLGWCSRLQMHGRDPYSADGRGVFRRVAAALSWCVTTRCPSKRSLRHSSKSAHQRRRRIMVCAPPLRRWRHFHPSILRGTPRALRQFLRAAHAVIRTCS